MKQTVDIYEVGPRDGFQNLRAYLPREEKLRIIDGILQAGVRHVQVTSFVSPKALPQMRDAREVAEACQARYDDVDFLALVPNLRGAQLAWESGIRKVSYVVSLSESHNRANINRTHAESLAELRKIREDNPDLHICLDLATTFGCPFEGKMPVEAAVAFAAPYAELVQEIDLCDTIGVANPRQVRETIRAMQEAYPQMPLQVHIHDTRNMGMVNTLAAIECGVTAAQSTLGGLGGCPFAPGASGNLATEDLVYMLNDMGYDTGIDFGKLLEVSRYQKEAIPDGIFSGHQMRISRSASCG